MPIDYTGKVRRLIKIYRIIGRVEHIRNENRKLRSALQEHSGQSDILMDSAEIANRIYNREVRSVDVHRMGRAALNSTPRIYEAVSRYIRDKKNA